MSDLFPHGGDVSRAEFWTGLRPMTPDGTPILAAADAGAVPAGLSISAASMEMVRKFFRVMSGMKLRAALEP